MLALYASAMAARPDEDDEAFIVKLSHMHGITVLQVLPLPHEHVL